MEVEGLIKHVKHALMRISQPGSTFLAQVFFFLKPVVPPVYAASTIVTASLVIGAKPI